LSINPAIATRVEAYSFLPTKWNFDGNGNL